MRAIPCSTFVLAVILASAISPAIAGTVSAGYSQVGYTMSSPPAAYDANADVLSISGNASYSVTLAGCNSYLCNVSFGATQTLIMNLAEDGSSTGGVFTVYIPGQLGSPQRLMLSGIVTGAKVLPKHISGGGEGLWITVNMNTTYSDPILGNWGKEMQFSGYESSNFSGVPLSNLPVLSQSWSSFRPSDYWDLYAYTTVASVPEHETYAMLLTGLGLLGGTTHRRKQKR